MLLNFFVHEDTFYSIFSSKKNFRKKLAENLLGSGSGSGTGSGSGSERFRKSDPDPVKNRSDPQHCFLETGPILWLHILV
jgi:hypothetical protein